MVQTLTVLDQFFAAVLLVEICKNLRKAEGIFKEM